MLNVRLESWLALNYVEMPVSEPNLRENFIDAVDIAKVECEHVSMMLYVDGLSVCKRLAPKTNLGLCPGGRLQDPMST